MKRNSGLISQLTDLFRTGSFTYWWVVSFATMLMFDIFWMIQTTFRPFSYFDFYTVLLLSAFLLSFPSLISRNGVIQTIWLLFFDFLFIANLMYCRTYFNGIPLNSYSLAGNLSDFGPSVADSFRWYFIFLPVLSLVAFAVYVFLPKIKKGSPSILSYSAYILALIIILVATNISRGGVMKRIDEISNDAFLSSSVVPIYSLAGYLGHDYHKTTEKLTAENQQKVADWISCHNNLSETYMQDSIRARRKIPKNLIVIFCESLESWVIDKEVEGKALTPNINGWLADSSTFYAPNVVTQVGSGRSIEGQLLIFTGVKPMKNKVYAYDVGDKEYPSLHRALKKDGGRSYILTSDKPYVWNQAMVAKALGADTLIHSENFKLDETAGKSRRISDGALMSQVVEKLKDEEITLSPGNNVMLIVTNSGHNPFRIPDKLKRISLARDYPEIIKDYMLTANYTDYSLGILMDYLRSRPDWEETMVVITGDHEGLADHRKEALANSASASLVDPLQHTPLIILNSPVGGRYDGPIGQSDIYTTILDLMKADSYSWRGTGFSVFDTASPGMAVGSSGRLEGDSVEENKWMADHLKEASEISDLILKFHLF